MLKKVYLELTNRCNLNCTMCYRHSWQEGIQDMDRAILHTCLEAIISSETIDTVVIGGIGEPSVAPSLLWVLETLKDKRLLLTTNGTLCEPDVLEAMVSYCDELVVSVDGDHETHEAIRGYPLEAVLTFVDAIHQLKQTKGQKKPMLSFQMVLQKSNAHTMPFLTALARDHHVEQVIVSHLLPTHENEVADAMIKRYENPEGKVWAKKTNLLSYRNGIHVKLPPMELKTERHCRFLETDALMVRSDGLVVPCYRLAHDGTEWVFGREKHIKAFGFGHVSEMSLQAIWDQPDYAAFRKTVLEQTYPSCIDCDLVDGCDMVNHADVDCYSNRPSCGDCLWARQIIYCV